ncbi:TPA: hypothetical protein ACG9YO_002905, partial [Enterococcus faecium]
MTDPLKNSLANVIYDILREADKVYSNYNGKVSWVIYSFLIKEFFKEQINNSYELGYHFTVYYE